MTLHDVPAGRAEPDPPEPGEDETEVLAEAAACGRRAANWIRGLPAPRRDRWIVGPLADAVETAMSTLDPGDCHCVDRDGKGGIDDCITATLARLPYAAEGTADWLTLDQHVRLLAVVAAVAGIPRLLANDPCSIERGQLARMCAVVNHAIR
ncbi:hypothetical protein [Streptomyces sp. NPDC059819]|uniref:hypothetical protein n=1 Tax=Streptomyces sp. NPDC059819 TaxID=3346963 RepID=UPI003658DD7F